MFDARTESTSGLTGVWAEENTRASLFEAMQRRETFAVSGPRIQVRLFGGWAFDAGVLSDDGWVASAYAKGVPMGSDLPPAAGTAPTFLVWAAKAPTSGNLDRIQIVKGWTKSGQSAFTLAHSITLALATLDVVRVPAPPVEAVMRSASCCWRSRSCTRSAGGRA